MTRGESRAEQQHELGPLDRPFFDDQLHARPQERPQEPELPFEMPPGVQDIRPNRATTEGRSEVAENPTSSASDMLRSRARNIGARIAPALKAIREEVKQAYGIGEQAQGEAQVRERPASSASDLRARPATGRARVAPPAPEVTPEEQPEVRRKPSPYSTAPSQTTPREARQVVPTAEHHPSESAEGQKTPSEVALGEQEEALEGELMEKEGPAPTLEGQAKGVKKATINAETALSEEIVHQLAVSDAKELQEGDGVSIMLSVAYATHGDIPLLTEPEGYEVEASHVTDEDGILQFLSAEKRLGVLAESAALFFKDPEGSGSYLEILQAAYGELSVPKGDGEAGEEGGEGAAPEAGGMPEFTLPQMRDVLDVVNGGGVDTDYLMGNSKKPKYVEHPHELEGLFSHLEDPALQRLEIAELVGRLRENVAKAHFMNGPTPARLRQFLRHLVPRDIAGNTRELPQYTVGRPAEASNVKLKHIGVTGTGEHLRAQQVTLAAATRQVVAIDTPESKPPVVIAHALDAAVKAAGSDVIEDTHDTAKEQGIRFVQTVVKPNEALLPLMDAPVQIVCKRIGDQARLAVRSLPDLRREEYQGDGYNVSHQTGTNGGLSGGQNVERGATNRPVSGNRGSSAGDSSGESGAQNANVAYVTGPFARTDEVSALGAGQAMVVRSGDEEGVTGGVYSVKTSALQQAWPPRNEELERVKAEVRAIRDEARFVAAQNRAALNEAAKQMRDDQVRDNTLALSGGSSGSSRSPEALLKGLEDVEINAALQRQNEIRIRLNRETRRTPGPAEIRERVAEMFVMAARNGGTDWTPEQWGEHFAVNISGRVRFIGGMWVLRD